MPAKSQILPFTDRRKIAWVWHLISVFPWGCTGRGEGVQNPAYRCRSAAIRAAGGGLIRRIRWGFALYSACGFRKCSIAELSGNCRMSAPAPASEAPTAGDRCAGREAPVVDRGPDDRGGGGAAIGTSLSPLHDFLHVDRSFLAQSVMPWSCRAWHCRSSGRRAGSGYPWWTIGVRVEWRVGVQIFFRVPAVGKKRRALD